MRTEKARAASRFFGIWTRLSFLRERSCMQFGWDCTCIEGRFCWSEKRSDTDFGTVRVLGTRERCVGCIFSCRPVCFPKSRVLQWSREDLASTLLCQCWPRRQVETFVHINGEMSLHLLTFHHFPVTCGIKKYNSVNTHKLNDISYTIE